MARLTTDWIDETTQLRIEELPQNLVNAIRHQAIDYLANVFMDAFETGHIGGPLSDALDIERMIRQHGHDNYHPNGLFAD